MARKLAVSRRLDAGSAVEVVLRGLLRSIEPTATQKSGAQRSHKHLRQELDSGQGATTAAYLDDERARALATKARISRDKLLAAYDARSDSTLEQHILNALRA